MPVRFLSHSRRCRQVPGSAPKRLPEHIRRYRCRIARHVHYRPLASCRHSDKRVCARVKMHPDEGTRFGMPLANLRDGQRTGHLALHRTDRTPAPNRPPVHRTRKARRSNCLLARSYFSGGPPVGIQLSRSVNRKICDVSSASSASLATQSSSCRSMSASNSTCAPTGLLKYQNQFEP